MKNLRYIRFFADHSWHINRNRLNRLLGYLFVLQLLLLSSKTMAQQCGGTSSVLAKWNFNTETIQCNGAEQLAPTPITNPSITPGATYCPNINNGCAAPTLGSVGHQNTPQYQNAICLANFYNVEAVLASGQGAPYNPNATTFDPEGKANLSVWYNFPAKQSGCLSSFQLKVLQKQFNGSQLNFEKQGVAVKRNGVLIYSQTQNITAANINGTPFTFNFTGSEFCTDGSEVVEFEIIFGLVHRLTGPAMPGTPGQTGYDDICVNGYCQTLAFGGIIPATCGASGPNNDAKVLIQNFASGDRYDYVQGETYTGSATYASGSTAIPANGEIPNFSNPVSATKYTFRVFQQNCYSDFTVTLEPKYCCIVPTGNKLLVIPATCNGTTANSDAQIQLSDVSGGTKTGISAGTSYTGPDFASASTLTAGAFTFANLQNPLVSQIYTIRIYNDANCYIDLQTTLYNKSCIVPCTPPNGMTLTSTKATCTGSTKNADATIFVTNVNGGDRVGMSPSINYSGPDYATAANLVNGSYTFTGINTPNGMQIYTIRVYNTSDGCYIDKTVEIADAECGTCKYPSAFVVSAGTNICESNGANNQSAFESCKTNGFIDLELSKTVNPPNGSTCTLAGTSFVWTLTIQNKGTMTATGVNVVDLIPAGLSITATNPSKGTYYGGSGWEVGTLAANETATLTITTIALNAGTYTNCAYVNKALPDNDPDSSPNNTEKVNEDDDACASITVIGANSPSISKSFNSMQIKPNTSVRMTIKITNNNTTPITLTSDFVDTFPSTPAQMVVASTPNVQVSAGIILPSSGITATAGGTSVTLPIGTVLAPGLNQFSVDVSVPSLGNYCNTIAPGALKTDIGESCLKAEACVIANPDFKTPPIVTKSMSPETVDVGQTTTLTIKIENKNSTPMTLNQVLVDKLPAGLTVSGAINSSCGGASLQNNNTEIVLAAGTSIAANTTCTISVPVTASANGQYCNTIIMNAIYTTVGTDTELGNEEIAQGCLTVKSVCTAPNAGKDTTIVCMSGSAPSSIQLVGSPSGGAWSALSTNPAGTNIDVAGLVSLTNTTAQGKTYKFVYTLNSCSDTLSLIVPICPCVSPTNVTASSNSPINIDETINLTSTGGISYSWAGPNSFTSTSQNPTITNATLAMAGTYTVTVTGNGTCTATATTAVIINQKGSIGNYIWKDTNKNGLQESNEAPVVGMRVILWSANANGSKVAKLDSIDTNALGNYLFINLDKGDYIIQFVASTAPADCDGFTTPNNSNDETDSDTDLTGYTLPIKIDPSLGGINKDNTTIDAGLIPKVICPKQACISISAVKIR